MSSLPYVGAASRTICSVMSSLSKPLELKNDWKLSVASEGVENWTSLLRRDTELREGEREGGRREGGRKGVREEGKEGGIDRRVGNMPTHMYYMHQPMYNLWSDYRSNRMSRV